MQRPNVVVFREEDGEVHLLDRSNHSVEPYLDARRCCKIYYPHHQHEVANVLHEMSAVAFYYTMPSLHPHGSFFRL